PIFGGDLRADLLVGQRHVADGLGRPDRGPGYPGLDLRREFDLFARRRLSVRSIRGSLARRRFGGLRGRREHGTRDRCDEHGSQSTSGHPVMLQGHPTFGRVQIPASRALIRRSARSSS
ncbi:hypothetical protein RZS08_02670, partial [Arthrospira platensis SPKY1]|nr:hypothetical protein [Arthrospira platensis SPKY1]